MACMEPYMVHGFGSQKKTTRLQSKEKTPIKGLSGIFMVGKLQESFYVNVLSGLL